MGAVGFALLQKEPPESPKLRSDIAVAGRSQLTGTLPRSESGNVTGKRLEANALIARLEPQMLAGEALDSSVLNKIKRVVRSLENPAHRASVILLFPRWLYPYLGDVAMEITQEAEFETKNFVTTDYSNIVEVLGRTPTKEAGAWLLRELEEIPDFEYPEVPPQPWFNNFHSRGLLGDVAKAVVIHGGLGDTAVMDVYAQAILGSSGDRQRVLVWALGESRDYADFEFLVAVRGSMKDSVILREIDLALNKIAAYIGSDAAPSSDSDSGEFGPHFFSVFPMLGNERHALAERQQVEHAKAVAYIEANGLSNPEFGLKY